MHLMVPIMALDSVVGVQEMFISHGSLLTNVMEKHSNQINTLWRTKEKGSRLTDSQI